MKSISQRTHKAGFSLAETVVSISVALITLTGVMAMNSSALKLVWSSRQVNAATLCLQERVEQLRIANWRQLTDAAYLKSTFFATMPKSAAPLGDMVEKVTVSAYPDSASAGAIVVERSASGTSITSDDLTMESQSLARVDLEVNWTGGYGRNRTRTSSTIISKGGISKLNLAMTGVGTAGSAATPVSESAEPTPTPDPSATPDPEATPTPTPTPTPAPTGGGSSKGRGNISGKSGKK